MTSTTCATSWACWCSKTLRSRAGCIPGTAGFASSVAEEAASSGPAPASPPEPRAVGGQQRRLCDCAVSQPATRDRAATFPVAAGPRSRCALTVASSTKRRWPSRCGASIRRGSYWPGSPYGRQSADPNDRIDGDCHIWVGLAHRRCATTKTMASWPGASSASLACKAFRPCRRHSRTRLCRLMVTQECSPA
jgi:hypothetical protein